VDFWQWIWTIFMWFLLFAFLMVFFACFSDLLRDDELSGWAKGAWVVFLILATPIAVLVYLIARGTGMARRSSEQVQAFEAAQADDIRNAAGPSGSAPAAEQVAKAEELLVSGAISQQEFEHLKANALA
jgi:hypothetical protein